MATKMKPSPTNENDTIFEIEMSDQPGAVVELVGYGITTFDPNDVEFHDDDEEATVGGLTTFYLTAADVDKLREYFAR